MTADIKLQLLTCRQ